MNIKDDSFNTSQTYRQILENVEKKGFSTAVVVPLKKFYILERNEGLKNRISEILKNLGEERPKGKFGRNIDIVANGSNECVSRCVGDVLDGAAKGAGIGGAIGVGGGPAVGAAGAAVIGGALGGVRCATSKDCEDESKDKGKNKFTFPPGYDFDLKAPGIKLGDRRNGPAVDKGPIRWS